MTVPALKNKKKPLRHRQGERLNVLDISVELNNSFLLQRLIDILQARTYYVGAMSFQCIDAYQFLGGEILLHQTDFLRFDFIALEHIRFQSTLETHHANNQ